MSFNYEKTSVKKFRETISLSQNKYLFASFSWTYGVFSVIIGDLRGFVQPEYHGSPGAYDVQ